MKKKTRKAIKKLRDQCSDIELAWIRQELNDILKADK